MKIRNGFVSNSSSSSFVIAVKKEVHEEVLKQLTGYEKAIINDISQQDTIFGVEVFIIGDLDVHGCSYIFEDLSDYEEAGEDEANNPWDALDRYENLVKQNENAWWYWSIG